MKNLINLAWEGEPTHLVNMDFMVDAVWRTPFDGGASYLVLHMANGESITPGEHEHTVVEWLDDQGYRISEPPEETPA